MKALAFVRLIAVVCAGLLAGIYLHDRAAAAARAGLSASSFVQYQQTVHLTFVRMMPALMLGAVLAGLAWLILVRSHRRSPELWLPVEGAIAYFSSSLVLSLNADRAPQLKAIARLLLNAVENHMKRTALIIPATICFMIALSSVHASRQSLETIQWGQPNDGVQLSLTSTGSSLQLSLRNISDRDVTLNLGVMMANGKVQLPNNISLNFRDAQGKTRLFKFADKRYPAGAGRLDDYVIPLRAGSTYTLQLTFDQFWSYETKEF